MARVTVEDCIIKIPNRFDLVMVAAQRARDISSGAALTIERDNDKNPVVALREIADTTIDLEALTNAVVQGLRKHVETEEPVEEGSFGTGDTDILSDLSQTADEAVAGRMRTMRSRASSRTSPWPKKKAPPLPPHRRRASPRLPAGIGATATRERPDRQVSLAACRTQASVWRSERAVTTLDDPPVPTR